MLSTNSTLLVAYDKRTSTPETLGDLSESGEVAMQLISVVNVPASDEETAVQAIMIHEKIAGTTDKSANPIPSIIGNYIGVRGKYHTVVRGDWLRKIAQHCYGNMK